MKNENQNHLVEFNSQMNRVAFHNFKAIELDLFMAICFKMKRTGEKIINLSFDEILKLLPSVKKTIKRDNSKLEKTLINMYEKLLSLAFSFENEKTYLKFVLFTKFKVDKERKNIEIKVNEEFSFVLNQISGQYTKVELGYFSNFKSAYSKHLFKILKQFQNEKKRDFHWCELEAKDFRNRLDIPKSYEARDINKRVLKPIQEDIGAVLQDFTIEKKKIGNSIKSYRFTWTTNKKNIIEVSEIEQYWTDNFPGINFTKKHREILEKLLRKNSMSYIKNYLKEQWEYVNNSTNIKNKKAYFSSLVLGEKAVPKDYVPREYQEEKKKIQENRLFELSTPKSEIKKIKTEDLIQENLFDRTENDIEVIEISMEEYQKRYLEYLGKNKDTETQRNIFSMLMKKDGYVLKEKKIYTIEDIPEEKLLGKNGKKLVGGALKMRIKKCLDEMNSEVKG